MLQDVELPHDDFTGGQLRVMTLEHDLGGLAAPVGRFYILQGGTLQLQTLPVGHQGH